MNTTRVFGELELLATDNHGTRYQVRDLRTYALVGRIVRDPVEHVWILLDVQGRWIKSNLLTTLEDATKALENHLGGGCINRLDSTTAVGPGVRVPLDEVPLGEVPAVPLGEVLAPYAARVRERASGRPGAAARAALAALRVAGLSNGLLIVPLSAFGGWLAAVGASSFEVRRQESGVHASWSGFLSGGSYLQLHTDAADLPGYELPPAEAEGRSAVVPVAAVSALVPLAAEAGA